MWTNSVVEQSDLLLKHKRTLLTWKLHWWTVAYIVLINEKAELFSLQITSRLLQMWWKNLNHQYSELHQLSYRKNLEHYVHHDLEINMRPDSPKHILMGRSAVKSFCDPESLNTGSSIEIITSLRLSINTLQVYCSPGWPMIDRCQNTRRIAACYDSSPIVTPVHHNIKSARWT